MPFSASPFLSYAKDFDLILGRRMASSPLNHLFVVLVMFGFEAVYHLFHEDIKCRIVEIDDFHSIQVFSRM